MKTEQQLDDLIAALPRELAPQRDLWPDIEKQLILPQQHNSEAPVSTMPQRRLAPVWLSAAAAAVLTFWFWPVTEQPVPIDIVSQNAGVEAAPQPLWQISSQLQQQLIAEQKRQLKGLQQVPTGFSDWTRQLKIWQNAQQQIELALHYQPDDQKLIHQLQRIQQQQLSYIAKLVQTSELT